VRFSSRLSLVLLPVVLLPAILAGSILFATTRLTVRDLYFEALDLELRALERQSELEAELLDRLGVAASPFYSKSARKKLAAFAAGLSGTPGAFLILDEAGRILLGPPGIEAGEAELLVAPFGADPGRRLVSFPAEGLRYIGRELLLPAWGWRAFALIDEGLPARTAFSLIVPAIAFLAAGALAAGAAARFLARRVSRPVERLVAATRRMGSGELSARAEARGDEEFLDLASSFNEMAGRLAEMTSGLEATVASRTEELSAANAGLRSALEELREAQDHIVRSERLSALGQLSAGIAHELNTPLGAIASSNRSLSEILDRDLIPALSLAAGLGPERLACFLHLLELGLAGASGRLDFPDRAAARAARRSLAVKLEEAGSPAAAELASLAEELGVVSLLLSDEEGLLGFFADPECAALLESASGLVAARRAAQIVETAASKAVGVVGALRGYLLPDRGEASLEPVDLAAEIETVLVLVHHRSKLGVELSRSFEPGLMALGTAAGLGQVWMNLVNNALQAMEYKGRLELSSERRGDRAVVRIADSGPGIPEEIRQRIFEPFFTTKKRGEGIGLGLDICRKIVESCGGSISFESRPGRTVFSVELPAAPQRGTNPSFSA